MERESVRGQVVDLADAFGVENEEAAGAWVVSRNKQSLPG